MTSIKEQVSDLETSIGQIDQYQQVSSYMDLISLKIWW